MPLGFSSEPLQVVERQFPLLHGARSSGSRQPDRLPNTMRSSRELPINRFRPCNPRMLLPRQIDF